MKKITSNIILAIVLLLVLVRCNENKQRLTERHSEESDRLSEKQRLMADRGQKPGYFEEYYNAITRTSTINYGMNFRMRELEKAKKNMPISNARIANNITEVIARGPGNVGGRTRAIVVDPDDATHSTWFAGSASGGIWKTTDKGDTWENLTPDLPILSTNAMAMAPSNHNVIYAGTGEGFFNVDAVIGDGVFKSISKGAVGSWLQLPSTTGDLDFQNVNRIIVSPDNENIVVIATNTAIFKSIDGGSSWDKVYNSNDDRVQDIKSVTDDFSIQFAAVNSVGILKSVDSGSTWELSSEGISKGERFELAVAPSNAQVVFTSTEVELEDGSFETVIYRSQNQGDSWAIVQLAAESANDGNFLGEQGWYDNTLAVNPYDENELFLGGVYIGKFTVVGEETVGAPDFQGVELENADFLSFVNFSQPYFNGGLAIGNGSNPSSDFFSVEIRFGPGKTQKAHRFTVPSNGGANSDGGAGIPDADYAYQDYVDVPFEVWDIESDRQLMISFRDQQNDIKFNLNTRDDTNDPGLLTAREYLFISNVTYSESADTEIVKGGGNHLYKNVYFFWPILTDGFIWSENDIPDGLMRINYGPTVFVEALPEIVSDSRGTYGGKNGQVHADHHNLTIIPVDSQTEAYYIINGNDGGLGFSEDNGNSWKQITDGYVTTQFYGADKKPKEDEFLGGMQDNGTWISPSGEVASVTTHYSEQIGGDGFEVIWHAQDPNKAIGGYYNNSFFRMIDGNSWIGGTNGFIDGDGPFISRLASSRTNPDVLFAVGATGVYRTTNFAEQWRIRRVSIGIGWTFTFNDAAYMIPTADVEVSQANHKIVWAGGAMTDDYAGFGPVNVVVSKDNAGIFEPTTRYEHIPGNGNISGLSTHPWEDSTAFVLFSYPQSPKVIKTTDLGKTWTDLSGFEGQTTSSNGFPDVPVYCLLVFPNDPSKIWVGTDIGIFESTDEGATWAYADNGVPAAAIWSMKVVDDQVVLGTHGRGIWTVRMSDLDISQTLIKSAEYIGDLTVKLNTDFRAEYDKVEIYHNNELVETLSNIGPSTTELELGISLTENLDGAVHFVTEKDGISWRSAKQFYELDFVPELISLKQSTSADGTLDLVVNLKEMYDEVDVYLNSEKVSSLGAITEVGEKTVNIAFTQSGKNEVYVVAQLGGLSFESTILSTTAVILSNTDVKEVFTVYPNPTSDYVHIQHQKLELANPLLKVFDLSGNEIMSMSNFDFKGGNTLDVSTLKSGVYFLKLVFDDETLTQRIIKR